MKKVIRLTESDLVNLIKKTISEQKPDKLMPFQPDSVFRPKVNRLQRINCKIDINPDKLKIGDGSKKNPYKKELVKRLQIKLYNAGFLKIKDPNNPDGIFGEKTQNALNTYHKFCKRQKPETTTTTTTPTPNNQSSNKDESIFSTALNKINQAWTNTQALLVPIHIRIFSDYLVLRRKPFTLKDMSTKEQEALRQMINYGYKNKFKDGSYMNFYDISNKMNSSNNGGEQIDFRNKKSFGFNQLDISSLYTKLAMSLGNAKVKKTASGYNVTDIYDFNNYQKNPEQYTLKELPNTIKSAAKKIWDGKNYIQGIEQMVSYYQKLGYKGIPVNIDLPNQ